MTAIIMILILSGTAMTVPPSVYQSSSVYGQQETTVMVVKQIMYWTTSAEIPTSLQDQQLDVTQEADDR